MLTRRCRGGRTRQNALRAFYGRGPPTRPPTHSREPESWQPPKWTAGPTRSGERRAVHESEISKRLEGIMGFLERLCCAAEKPAVASAVATGNWFFPEGKGAPDASWTGSTPEEREEQWASEMAFMQPGQEHPTGDRDSDSNSAAGHRQPSAESEESEASSDGAMLAPRDPTWQCLQCQRSSAHAPDFVHDTEAGTIYCADCSVARERRASRRDSSTRVERPAPTRVERPAPTSRAPFWGIPFSGLRNQRPRSEAPPEAACSPMILRDNSKFSPKIA